jgi:hypothetical protein
MKGTKKYFFNFVPFMSFVVKNKKPPILFERLFHLFTFLPFYLFTFLPFYLFYFLSLNCS